MVDVGYLDRNLTIGSRIRSRNLDICQSRQCQSGAKGHLPEPTQARCTHTDKHISCRLSLHQESTYAFASEARWYPGNILLRSGLRFRDRSRSNRLHAGFLEPAGQTPDLNVAA